MTEEKVQFGNPFAVLFAKVDHVEKLLVNLSEKLAQVAEEPSNLDERLTRKQITLYYKISYGTIHNLMKSGKLPYEKVGRKTLFRREDLENCFTNKKG